MTFKYELSVSQQLMVFVWVALKIHHWWQTLHCDVSAPTNLLASSSLPLCMSAGNTRRWWWRWRTCTIECVTSTAWKSRVKYNLYVCVTRQAVGIDDIFVMDLTKYFHQARRFYVCPKDLQKCGWIEFLWILGKKLSLLLGTSCPVRAPGQ